jgi:DNA-binding NtrC family response regulator
VLVVEDDEAVRLLTRTILERSGYRVFDAPTLQQAETLFEQHMIRFSLLVTDVMIPGSSGPQLFDRRQRQHADLKVLYASGHADGAIVHRGQLDPGLEFLQKPYSADTLSRRVREVLDR